MCNCSRMAFRCGDVDASRSGGAGGASATFRVRGVALRSLSQRLACDPDLFCRPLSRPIGLDVLVIGMRLGIRLCEQLDETLDLEPVRAQQVDPVAVTELELDLACVRPLDLAQLELGS